MSRSSSVSSMSRSSSTSGTPKPSSPEIAINGEPLPQAPLEAPRILSIKVTTPNFEPNSEKTFEFSLDETVWIAKQIVLLEFANMDIKDPLNFGFYMPPYSGRAGKFLDEERCMREYPMDRSQPFLEFRYKRRIFRHLPVQDEKKLQKVNTKSKRRKFMDLILTNNVQGLEKQLAKGLDPNFQDERTGETPFIVASMQTNCMDLMKVLVLNGAHLDFRAKDGSTAVHKATITGRVDSLKCLLDLGSSPNYKDSKGLTPLYWCVLAGSNAYICELLLAAHAHIGVCDLQGAQEIHQACKLGYVQHLEHLIYFGANLNARTGSGNTPLHICALENQEGCARVLLFRGADRTLTNLALQTAYDVAVVAGNVEVGALIKDFDQVQVRAVMEVPEIMGRHNGAHVSLSSGSESHPNGGLVRAESSTDVELAAALKKRKMSVKNSLSDQDGHDDDFSGSEASSDSEEDDKPKRYSRNFSNAGVGTRRSPAPLKMNAPGAAVVRNRLYASVPGRLFFAVADYAPQHAGEIALIRGESVEVLYVGEKGFFEGSARGKVGWFPSYCVQEIKTSAKQNPRSWFGKRSTAQEAIDLAATHDSPLARVVTLRRGEKGFGFHLRGASSHLPHIDFTPTPQFPALQYIGEVDRGGVADRAGLRAGDFVLEINGENVVNATQGYAVALISKAGGKSLDLKVVTVAPETFSNSFLLPNGTIRSKDVVDTDALQTNVFPVGGQEVVDQRPPVVVTPIVTKRTPAPPPPTRASSTALSSVQSSGQADVVGDSQVGVAADSETVVLEARGESKETIKSMWSDNAYKLQGNEVEIREDNIARGMGRKQKALSYDLASEFEKKFQEITKQVTVNSSDYPGVSSSVPPPAVSAYAEEGTIVVAGGMDSKLDVFEKHMAHSSSESSSSLGSAGSGSPGSLRVRNSGPQRQTPPPYEYSIESLRRRRLSEENHAVTVPDVRSVPIDVNIRPRSVIFPTRPLVYDPDVRADLMRRSPRFPQRYPLPGHMQQQMQYNQRLVLGSNGTPIYVNHDHMIAAYNHRSAMDDQNFASMRSHNHHVASPYAGQPMHAMQQFGGTSKHGIQGPHTHTQIPISRDYRRQPSPSDARGGNDTQQYYPDKIAQGELLHSQQNYRVVQEQTVLSLHSSKQPAPNVNRERKPMTPAQAEEVILYSHGRALPNDFPSHSSRSGSTSRSEPPPLPEPDYDVDLPETNSALVESHVLSINIKPEESSTQNLRSSMLPPASAPALPPPSAPAVAPLNNLEANIVNAVAARNARMQASQLENVSNPAGKVTSPTSTTVNRRQQHPAVDVSQDSDGGFAALRRSDSATGSEYSSFMSSSNVSLDSQSSKDSGYDQFSGDSSLLAQAVAKQRTKMAERESTGRLEPPKELQEMSKVLLPVADEKSSLHPSDIVKPSPKAVECGDSLSIRPDVPVDDEARSQDACTTAATPPSLLAFQIAPPAVKKKPKSGSAKALDSSSITTSESAQILSESDPNWPLTPTSEDAATTFLDDVIADAEASIDYALISVNSRGSASPAVKRHAPLTVRPGDDGDTIRAGAGPESARLERIEKETDPFLQEAYLPPPPEEFVEGLNDAPSQDRTQQVEIERASDPPPPYSPRTISVSTLSKIPGQLSGKSFMDWSVEEVCVWLDHLQLGQYKKAFVENDIQGKHLPDLSKDEMKELGVTKLGHRMTLDDEITKLKKAISEI